MKFGMDMAFIQRVRTAYGERYSPEGARKLAAFYWRVLLLLSFLLLATAIGYGEWDLYGVLKELGKPPERTLPPASLDRAALNSTVSALQARQNGGGSTGGAAYTDPSK